MRLISTVSLFSVSLGLALSGCDNKPSPGLAPSSTALAPAAAKSDKAIAFEIQGSGSKVSFLMNAPVEKISGEAADSTKGQIFVDPTDITKTTALIQIDLDRLTLYQQKRADENGEFGERTKSEKQNEHARAWLEIASDAPADQRELNRWVEFKIDKVADASATDLSKLTGAERKLTATVEGEFRLHQRKVRKTAKIEAVFKYEGDKAVSVSIKTLAPVVVGLEEHDVKPRELFGKLAQKTLSDLGQKVAKEAPIELEFSAKLK